MGRVGEVVGYDADDDGTGGDVKVDPGGGDLTTPRHYAPPGDDSPPLDGDWVAVTESAGSGIEAALGYEDDTAKVAARGEKRIYARSGAGAVVCVVYLKGDGTLSLQAPGGDAEQPFVRGDDLMTWLDAIITAASTAIGGVPAAGGALKAAFDAAVTAAAPLKAAALSSVIKGE